MPKPPGMRLPGTTLPRRNQNRDGSLDPRAVDENFRAVERELRRIPQVAGDRPPEVELNVGQEYDGADLLGTMTVVVRDVGENFDGFVRFARIEGAAEFDHSDPTDAGVWNLTDSTLPYEASVTLQPKHGGLIAVAVPYRTFSEPNVTKWVIRSHRYDADFDAELTGHELAFDTDGYPLLSLTGDEDVAKHYVRMTVADDKAGATPADPTGTGDDATLEARQGNVRFDGTGGVADKQAKMGKMVGYKVLCENADGVKGSVFGPYFKRRGDSKTHKPTFHVTAIRSGSTVTVTVSAADQSLALTALEFRKQAGGGSLDPAFVSTWDSTTGALGTDESITRAEDVSSPPGLAAKLIWRATWTDEFGNSQFIGDEIDVSHLEAVSKTLRFGHANVLPFTSATTWILSTSYLQPGTAGVQSDFIGLIPVPKGVVLTGATARMSRGALTDLAEVKFVRVGDSGFDSTVCTLTHSTTGWQTTAPASFTEDATETSTYDYAIWVALRGAAVTDALFRYFELTYNAPSYDKTY